MKNISAVVVAIFVSAAFTFSIVAQTCPVSGGCMDPDFGGGDLVRVPNAGEYASPIILRQSDGKVIFLATGSHISEGQFVTRLNANGSIDTSFAGDGTLAILWRLSQRKDTYYGNVTAIALQNVGGSERLLVAGLTPILSGSKVYAKRLRIDRYELDGSLDTSWGNNGSLQVLTLNGADSMIVQASDQKIIYGAYAAHQVIRLSASGQLDTSFGSGGIASASYPNYLYLDSSDRLLVAGWVNTAPNRGGIIITPTVTRFTTSGSKDTTFANNGTAQVGFNTRFLYTMVSTDPFGNVLFSWSVGPTDATTDFAVERFTDSGIPDATFGGGDGISTVDFNGQRDLVMASAAQIDGSIVLVGNTAIAGSGSGSDIAMARLDYSGNLDAAFGTGGRVVFPHVPGGEAFRSILMVSNPLWTGERFYAAGTNTQNNQLLVARFLEY